MISNLSTFQTLQKHNKLSDLKVMNHRFHRPLEKSDALKQVPPTAISPSSFFNFANIGANNIQTELRISQPDDVYEQEADCVANKIMNMTQSDIEVRDRSKQHTGVQLMHSQHDDFPIIHRQYSEEKYEDEEEEEEEPYREAPEPIGLSSMPIHEQEEEEEKWIQRKTRDMNSLEIVGDIVEDIDKLSSGSPLDTSIREFMESRFGHDFNNVRVHTDEYAAMLASSLNARAFTIGDNILFGAQEYSSHTFEGRKLLAHELTHVVQQGAAPIENPQSVLNISIGRSHQHLTMTIQRSLTDAFNNYRGRCDCGEDLGNNCAHYLSDALIRSGYAAELDGGNGALYRRRHGRIVCRAGRPVRAKEIMGWFVSKATDIHSGEPIGDTRHWAVYQKRASDGQEHVVIHAHNGTGTTYTWRGTGNYPTWRTQRHHTW